MIQINIPNDQLAEFTDQLLHRRLGIYSTTWGFGWYPVTGIEQQADQVVLSFRGEDWDEDLEEFVDVTIKVTRPTTPSAAGLPAPRTAAYLPEAVAEDILSRLSYPTAVGA